MIALLFTLRMHTAHSSWREAKGAVRTSMAALLLSVKVAHMKGEDGHLAQHQCRLFRPGTVIHPGRAVCLYFSVRNPTLPLIIVSEVAFACTQSSLVTYVPVCIIKIIAQASDSCILFFL